jgi:zinc and cadmium transporter
MRIWLYALVSVTIVSLLSLIGIFTLVLRRDTLHKITLFLVCFAVGGLFGDAFIHLLPASFEKLGTKLSTSLLIIAGIFIFFILEKFLRWRHCHAQPGESGHTHPVAMMNLVGDAAHNLIDGMLIGATYTVGIPIGMATTLAVIMHEIPHEIGNFGIFLHSGFSIRKALIFNFLSALTAILGTIISLLAGSRIQNYSYILLPITAGGFIYVAGSDLIPEIHSGCDVKVSAAIWQFICILGGIAMMVGLVFLE